MPTLSPRFPGLPCRRSSHYSRWVCITPPVSGRLGWRRRRLYLCTDARRERGDLAEFADAALAGGVDIIQLRDKGSAGEQRFGPLEARARARRARGARRRGPPARRVAGGQRPGRHRPCGRRRRAAPRPGRPAAGDRPRHRRAATADRPVHPRPRAGRRRGGRAGGLFLRRAVLADARRSRVGPRPASTWSGPRPNGARTSRGSRSAASTSSDCRRCSTRGARRVVVVRAITAADDPQAAARRLKAMLTTSG